MQTFGYSSFSGTSGAGGYGGQGYTNPYLYYPYMTNSTSANGQSLTSVTSQTYQLSLPPSDSQYSTPLSNPSSLSPPVKAENSAPVKAWSNTSPGGGQNDDNKSILISLLFTDYFIVLCYYTMIRSFNS